MPILKTEIFMKKMEAMYIYEVNMERTTIHNINLQGALIVKVILTLNIRENIFSTL